MNHTLTKSNQLENGNAEFVQSNVQGTPSYRPTYSPRFDIWEGDNEYVLYGDLPGVTADGLCIEYENRQVTIRGEVGQSRNRGNFLLNEFGVGDFHRSFAIGEAINSQDIRAELKDGVLTIHLPKVEEAKPRRIEVQAV